MNFTNLNCKRRLPNRLYCRLVALKNVFFDHRFDAFSHARETTLLTRETTIIWQRLSSFIFRSRITPRMPLLPLMCHWISPTIPTLPLIYIYIMISLCGGECTKTMIHLRLVSVFIYQYSPRLGRIIVKYEWNRIDLFLTLYLTVLPLAFYSG